MIIKTIKEFLIFRKLINSFQMIELKDADKIKLETFDKDLLKKVVYHSLDVLAKDIINEGYATDYIKGYKHGLFHLLSYFKKYNKI